MQTIKALLLGSFLFAACTDTQEPIPDGITFEVSTPDHVAGTFSRDGVSLVFDFSRDPVRETRVAELLTADGAHLMTSVLAGGVETMNLLDGRLSVSGPPSSTEPTVVGEWAAMDEMTATPEAKLLPELRATLSELGVDDELHTPDRAKDPGMRQVFSWADGYYHLVGGESHTFATWTFWYPTNVYFRNFRASCSTISMRSAGSWDTFPIRGYERQHWVGYWWGSPITITNLYSYVWWDGVGTCSPWGDVGVVVQ